MLEAGGLSSDCRSVVDDLDLDLAVLVVELNHGPPGARLSGHTTNATGPEDPL